MAKVKSLQGNDFVWSNLTEPTERLLRKLMREKNFHALAIEDCLTENQRPKIDEYEHYLFIVLHIPKVLESGRLEIDEIDIFIGHDFIITVHNNNTFVDKLFHSLSKKSEERERLMSKGVGYFLYEFIDEMFSQMFVMLDNLSAQTSQLEKKLFNNPGRQDLLNQILFYRKDLIILSRIIVPQRPVIAQLEHKKTKFLPDTLELYFQDAVDKVERLYTNVESLKELLNLLQQTNESVISHSSNNIIKVLTIFSVMMLPMTLVSGIYGMNLATLPFAQHQMSFIIVIGIMLAIAVSMVAFFKYKRWF